MPWSIASLASGAGASAAAGGRDAARRTSPARASGRARAARPGRAACGRGRRSAQAAAQLDRPRDGAHSPATSASAACGSGTPGRACPSRRSRGTAPSARAARRACRGRRSRPSSSTTISSASAIVESRWAITNVVRPAITSRSASLISCSVEASTDEVASSRIRIRGLARIARAIAIRWRWPPESVRPRSPTQRVVAVGQLAR